jgi:hypothetical protein
MSERDNKSFQTYVKNIKAKTGKTPDAFRKMAKQKGLTQAREILAWLKKDYGLGYGHGGMVYHLIAHADDIKSSPEMRTEKLFAGSKAGWRKPYAALETKVRKFGSDFEADANMTYVNLCRSGRKFAIVQPSAAGRLDIGIKLRGVAPAGRLEKSGSWNPMVTHRVRITDPKQIDQELLRWLKQAYDGQATKMK